MVKKQKYYVVWIGHQPGVYETWDACQSQTNGYPEAKFKSYSSRQEAEQAYHDGWKKRWGQSWDRPLPAKSDRGGKPRRRTSAGKDLSASSGAEIDYNSICVDVGTRGNPGPVEYKGVDTRTGEVLFSHGPIARGTNNLGEFLAIVHGLAYLDQIGSDKAIYSDSLNAIKWVRDKKVMSTLVRNESTREIWTLVDRALAWLHNHAYTTRVLKWRTEKWGEIKADYGRK